MLTESDLSIALAVRHFKGLYDEMGGARPQARHFGVLSVLTKDRFGPNRKRSTRRLSLSPGLLCRLHAVAVSETHRALCFDCD